MRKGKQEKRNRTELIMKTIEQKDSTTGKLMEKAGNMLHGDGIAEKGRAKREEAGLTSDDTSY